MLTADTYNSLLPPAQHRAAEATARLVLAAARAARDKIRKGRRPSQRLRPRQPPARSQPRTTR